MRYTERVYALVKNTMKGFERIKNSIKEIDMQRRNDDITDKRHGELLQELRMQKDALMLEAKKAIDEIAEMYRLEVWGNTLVHGEMLSEDAKLLQIEGFTLSPLQFTALVERHRNNPLMMQLLYNYKQKNPKLYTDYFILPDEKINAFNQYVGVASSIVANPDDKMKYAMFLDGYGMKALKICTEEIHKEDEAGE